MRVVQGESLHAKVHVKHLDWTNTAAVGNLLTQQHADLPSIQLFSSGLAPGLTAMLMMMVPALSLARPMIISSFSAQILKGISLLYYHQSEG